VSLVRFIVELCTLVFAEAWCAFGTRVHVTDAISLALTEAVATAVGWPASANIMHGQPQQNYSTSLMSLIIIIISFNLGTWPIYTYKKFELMLTRRTKAYSSSSLVV